MSAKKMRPTSVPRSGPTLRAQLADLQERYALSDKAALRYADDLEATAKREKELHGELLRLRTQLATTEDDRAYVEKQLAEANELLRQGK